MIARDRASLAGVSPTELNPGDDPVARFRAEATAVSSQVSECAASALADHVAEIAARHGATRVGVADDLPIGFEDVARAVAARGGVAVRFAEAARDRERLAGLEATVTGCVAAVAATGSVAVGSAAGRTAALIAPVHICVVERDRVVSGLRELLAMRPRVGGSMLALQTGPSRTADIEKAIVLGVHGPHVSEIVILDAASAR